MGILQFFTKTIVEVKRKLGIRPNRRASEGYQPAFDDRLPKGSTSYGDDAPEAKAVR